MNQHAAAQSRPNGLFAWYTPGHSDQLGDRLRLFDNTDGPPLELLRLRPDLACRPEFEHSLRARVAELRDFQDERYARVCRTDRLPEPGGGLAVVSERTEGPRLSEMLRLAEQHAVRVPAALAVAQLANLLDAVSALHRCGASVAHGALGPERLIVTGDGGLRITEYVLGSALGGLRLERERAWRQFGLALPADPVAFDQRTDVVQIGAIALALVLSRTLGPDDYPGRLDALIQEADRRGQQAGWERIWPRLRPWLERALSLDGMGFVNALEARDALTSMVGDGVPSLPERGTWTGFEAQVRGEEEQPILALDDWERSLTNPKERATLNDIDAEARGPRDRALAGGPRPAAALRDAYDPRAPTGSEEARVITEPQPEPSQVLGRSALGRRWPLPTLTATRGRVVPVLLAAVAVLALGEGLYIASRLLPAAARTVDSALGTTHVVTEPAGASVTVDGRPAGLTPASLQLAPGRHVVELAAGNRRRTVTVVAKAGETTSMVVELRAETAPTGQLRVATTPPGARVRVDGQPRGTSPVLIPELAPGEHEVVVEGRGRTVRQAVAVEAGVTAGVALHLPGSEAPAPGWLTIASPEEVQVYQEGELVGTSRSPKIMLPAGRHELDLVNEDLGLRTSEEVVVPVGRTTTLELSLPTARVAINATPWAEVWVDGKRVGETPLGAVPVTVGRHVVTFRHPELGERRVECVVSLNRPTRVGVDLRK